MLVITFWKIWVVRVVSPFLSCRRHMVDRIMEIA